MTTQLIVSPDQIESGLLKIWEGLAKEKKTRASLFNLVVFNKLSKRTDYVRSIVQRITEKFPCRTLFISEDVTSQDSYLKTAISVLMPKGPEGAFACDLIDIGVSGSEMYKVPFLITPHLLPDLPTYVLWTEDPSLDHPLFESLVKKATRVIFDSESADNLLDFSQKILDLHEKGHISVADLNWARTAEWRDLIIATFNGDHQIQDLEQMNNLRISFNSRETDVFCHLKIQSIYLLAWLSSRLGWNLKNAEKKLHFEFEKEGVNIEAIIESMDWENLGSGMIISTEITTKDGHSFQAGRIPDRPHFVKILTCSPDTCQLPYEFMLGQSSIGQSLVNEICMKGTNSHYIDMLKELIILDKEKLC